MLLFVGMGMDSPSPMIAGFLNNDHDFHNPKDLYLALLAVLAVGTASASYATWILSREFAW
ncbi:hypothetical protein LTR56_002005 [Elasticomyces elasticus]|nr:hypothetical protein LTR22_011590 [Elasticomyces elasticus]KAK3658149.1 hypothetical protein LTR56_002005 [Elasticomyces elasticus]KAK5764034.1 hypothetical protein LTS12_005727 [Elasticomyces elasticus]